MSDTNIARLHSNLRAELPPARARYLTQAMQLEESDSSGVVVGGILLTALLLVGGVFWSAVTQVSETAVATGSVAPKDNVHEVQHLEGGIVEVLFVNNGDRVIKGQELLRLVDTQVGSDLEQLFSRKVNLELENERLLALLNQRNPDFIMYSQSHPKLVQAQLQLFLTQYQSNYEQIALLDSQAQQKQAEIKAKLGEVAALKEELDLLTELYGMQADLTVQNLVSKSESLNAAVRMASTKASLREVQGQLRIAEKSLLEIKQRKEEALAINKEKLGVESSEVTAELAEVNEQLIKLKDRSERLSILAPVDGIVMSMDVDTVSAVIEPGQTLMEVVPVQGEMVVSAEVRPEDIGHIFAGQEVDVSFSSYEEQRFGTVKGELNKVSASTYMNEENQPYYKAEILLSKSYVGVNSEQNQIVPGMTVRASIITGEKSILDYILKPVYRGLNNTFHER